MSPTKPSIVLITGATSGIGRHAAIDLAGRGFRVFATGRNPSALQELNDLDHPNLTALPLDVTDEDSIESARELVREATKGHGVDVLINNAGYGDLGPAELITDGDLRAQFDTNVFGLMAVTRAFLPEMRERRSGRIINVSSIGGRLTMPLFGVYSASKYAVEALSDSLRMEMAAFGIRVVLIEPGPIKTNFSKTALDNADKYQASGPYATIVARAQKMAEFAERSSVGPHVITRAINKAITSRWPRARYVAPFRGHVMLAVASIMPTRLTDFVLRSAAGFTKKRLNAIASEAHATRNGQSASSASREATIH